jgi:hypothetical protein
MRLRGHVESNAGLRAAGWVTFVAGAIAGTVVALKTEEECSYGVCFSKNPYLFHGLAIIGVTGLVALLLVLQKDQAHIE